MIHQPLRRLSHLAAAITLLALLAGSLSPVAPVRAQIDDTSWMVPENLSNSAGTTEPTILVDSNEITHILWKDLFADFLYTHETEGGWTEPVALELPFYDLPYQLVADSGGFIHAAWLDIDGSLYHFAVRAENFATANWGSPARIAAPVVQFDLSVGANRQAHVVFVRAENTAAQPAGVYATSFSIGGQGWTAQRPVYLSQYFRTLQTPAGASPMDVFDPNMAHVDIESASIGEGTTLLAAWDHPVLKRIYFSQSTDLGQTWSEPFEVDGPDPSSTYQTPHQIRLLVRPDQWMILWQIGELDGSFCQLKYITSADQGSTWSSPADVMPGMTTCPEQSQFFSLDETHTLLFATIQNKIFLTGYDGQHWSPFIEETALRNFPDTETLNLVEFGCPQAAVSSSQLLVVGCDLSDGGDIWLSARLISDVDSWFLPPSGWSDPAPISLSGASPLDLSIAADNNGDIHALLNYVDPEAESSTAIELAYAQWNSAEISGPSVIFESIAGSPGPLDLKFNLVNRLVAVYGAGNSGELNFTWANSGLASASSSWAQPMLLQQPDDIGGRAKITVTPNGNIHIAYAVPINEGRGLYAIFSSDGGETWSEPLQVFDGAAQRCDTLPDLSIASSGDDNLYLLWNCAAAPGGTGPRALFASKSSDGGLTWSPPQLVVNRPVIWSRVITSDASVHWIWKESNLSESAIWHTYSTDFGVNWTPAKNISLLPTNQVFTTLTSDSNGRLHLVQILPGSGGEPEMQYLQFAEEVWSPGEDLALDHASITDISALSAVVGPANRLVVAYTGLSRPDVNGSQISQLVFTALPLNGGSTLPQPETTSPAETPPAAIETESLPTAPATEEATLEATPLPGAALPQTPPASTNSWAGLAFGVGITLIVIVGVFLFTMRRNRPEQF